MVTAGELSRSIQITPRDQHFAFSDIKERDWLGGDPVRSLIFNALSVTFPSGERFFINSVKAFKDEIHDEAQQAQIKAFITQEHIHTREHIVYNKQLEGFGCRAERLHQKCQSRLDRAKRVLSPLDQLAVTCALEHFTALLAERLLSDEELMEDAAPAYRDVWLWHAIEETEHKGVSFDVYQAVTEGRGYWRRAWLMVITTLLFFAQMLEGFSVLMKDVGLRKSVRAWLHLTSFLWGKPGMLRKMVLGWFAYFRPGFHPWEKDNRVEMRHAEGTIGRTTG